MRFWFAQTGTSSNLVFNVIEDSPERSATRLRNRTTMLLASGFELDFVELVSATPRRKAKAM